MQQTALRAAADPLDANARWVRSLADRSARQRERFRYSGTTSPLPPKSLGKSLNFGRPSFTESTFSP